MPLIYLDSRSDQQLQQINTDGAESDVYIGYAVYSNAGYSWLGDLDDVRILDRALIPTEISAVVNE